MNPREESSDGFAVNELHGFRIKIFNCLRTGKNLPFSAASVKAGFSCVVTIHSFSTFIPSFITINLERQLHFHQPSHPDFPATEPDDRVNRMATRAVHIAEVNPEKSAPHGGEAEGQKRTQPLIYKGCAVVVTVGLEPTTPSM